MFKKACLVIAFLIVSAFPALAAEKMPIAIMELQGIDVPVNTAKAVSELIRTELFNTGLFRVFERGEIEKVLKEQQFGTTGLTDLESAVKLGKMLQAKKVLVGSVSKLGSSFIVNARIIDVEKGEMEFAETGKSETETELDKAVEIFSRKIAARIEASANGTAVTPTVEKKEKPVKVKAEPKPKQERQSASSGSLRKPAIIFIGSGLVTGASFFLWKAQANSSYDAYSKLYLTGANFDGAWKKTAFMQTLEPTSLILGGALITTGIILLFKDSKSSDGNASLSNPTRGFNMAYDLTSGTGNASYTMRW